jgi:RNA polymerase sigma-70 factor, ECF subfamily
MHELRRSRAGFLGAYAAVVADVDEVWRYRDDLERLAHYLCRHRADAEDVAHSALMKAATKLDGFRGESSVRTWLHTITTNECRMLRRRRAPSSLDEVFDDLAAGATGGDLLAAEGVDPEEIAIELETRSELLRAMESLPDNQRCALLLKEGRGLSLEEIADVTGTTVSSVKSTLYRARRELRRLMQ